jgi:hypothetical protein
MAIANLMPFGASAYEVKLIPHRILCIQEAYNELAELGLKARELQSITWEAARALFPADEKNENIK